MTSDGLDRELRARLDKLVPPADDVAGWTGVRRRAERARQRRRGMVVSAAAVVICLVVGGAVVVGGTRHTDDERLRMANPPIASTAPTTTQLREVGPAVGAGLAAPAPASGTTPATGPSASAAGGPSSTAAAPGTVAGASGSDTPASVAAPSTGSTHPTATTAPSHTVAGAGALGAPSGTTAPTPATGTGSVPPPTTAATVPATTQPAPPSISQVQAAISRFTASDPGVVRSLTITQKGGHPVVSVALRADGQNLADQINSIWPDQTSITVGFFPYGSTVDPSAVVHCPSPTLASSSNSLAVTATAALNPGRIPSGSDFTGVLTVTNHGTTPIAFTSDLSTKVEILPPGSDDVVGCYDGTSSTVAVHGQIPAGGSTNFTLSGGTASADRSLGYSLPAGTYTGLVHLTLGNGLSVPFTFPVRISYD